MRYKLLGHTGLKVSSLCLGAMTFGEEWGFGASKSVSAQIFDTFAAAGGNFIDTADLYTNGTSERYLGEFIAAERERFVLATKYSAAFSDRHPNAGGNSRKHMTEAVNASLKRLGTEYIDLYWLHVWDFLTPVDEVMRALDDLTSAGKIVYCGISDAPAWVVAKANTLAELRGWQRFAALQIEHSLKQRESEAEYYPLAEDLDLAVTCWSPLGGGVLAGRYVRPGQTRTEGVASNREAGFSQYLSERAYDVADVVKAVAAESGWSPAQVALRWSLQYSPRNIPIIGARTLEQLQDNLGCLNIALDAAQMTRLEEVSAVPKPWPYSMLYSVNQRSRTYGPFYDAIDNHRRYHGESDGSGV